jgi:hypothetical protein
MDMIASRIFADRARVVRIAGITREKTRLTSSNAMQILRRAGARMQDEERVCASERVSSASVADGLKLKLVLTHMLKSVFKRLRDAGDRLTGGGLRKLVKRVLKASLHRAAGHPRLIAIGRSALRPFPALTANLERLASRPDAPSIQAELLVCGGTTDPDMLPASARLIYSKLQKAISDVKAGNRGAQ